MKRTWCTSALPERREERDWLTAFQAKMATRAAPPIRLTFPPSIPLVVGDSLLFQNVERITALDRRDGKLAWHSYTDGGLHKLFSESSKHGCLEQWRVFYEKLGPDDVVHGYPPSTALSCDGTRVFMVDDLLLPPHPIFKDGPFGALTDQVNRNSLKAYHLASGKISWELSGGFDRDSAFANSFFLGPPLPLHGKLYVLNEKAGDLYLACVETRDKDITSAPPPPAVIFRHKLATFRERLPKDLFRRLRTLYLAHHDGMLICPTNDGAVIGFDLGKRAPVWTYRYRNSALAPPPSAWRFLEPLIADGKAIVTAPDDDSIHCLNVADGRLLWKVAPEDDVYAAGIFGGKVLLVGRHRCRCLALADGKPLWQTITGIPAGRGVALSEHFYLLPLQATAPHWKAGLAAVAVDRGAVVKQALLPPGEVPGNLVMSGTEVLSQTFTGVSSYGGFTLPDRNAQDLSLTGTLTATQLDRFWSDLEQPDVDVATTAALLLACCPEQTLPYLHRELKTARADEALIGRLVGDLASANFEVRQAATVKLENLGELAEPTLRRLVATKPNLDLQQRADKLLVKIEKDRQTPTPTMRRQQRAVRAGQTHFNPPNYSRVLDSVKGAGLRFSAKAFAWSLHGGEA